MSSLNDIILYVSPNKETQNTKIIALVVDRSGSTATPFTPSSTVLEKELSVLSQSVLANDQNKYTLYSFDHISYYHGQVKVLTDENFVDLPEIKPGGITNTHLPLQEIVSKFGIVKPNKVIVFTDGQTNSQMFQFTPIVTAFKANCIDLEIVAVTANSLNMETLTASEERNIPGMDLVNMLGNSIDSLTIYSPFHCDTPYVGAQSSKVDKNALTFMGVPFKGLIPDHINKIIAEIEKNKDAIDSNPSFWGTNQITLKKFISEVGKMLSLLFINFPEKHIFVETTITKISGFSGFSEERVFNIMKYGFECTKSEKPIIYTNFEQHVKDSVVKKGEFADAVALLSTKGTTGGCDTRICLPLNGVCVFDKGSLSLTRPLGQYPNSVDNYSNAYFSSDANPQATRIAFRELCNTMRFPNARNSASVIFFVANKMSLMYISGVSKDTEHMKELQKLAIHQTSMEVMVAKGKYDGLGCFKHWQTGTLIPMNFSSPNTHTSLYTDSMINPLKLSEPIWWALMMSMLGIFKEQLPNYESSLKAICGDDITEDKFLDYIRAHYKDDVKGTILLEKLEKPKNSVFTLDSFASTDSIFKVKNHGQCKTETWYSTSEMDYIKTNGCVWCKTIVSDDMLEPVTIVDNNKKIADSMALTTPLMVGISAPLTASVVSQIPGTENNCVRINMLGITGSGKSTTTQLMVDYLDSNGWNTLVVSADKWSKKGFKGKDMQSQVYNEIATFDKKQGKLAIIVDICNENGVNDSCFGYNLSKYKSHTFVPNFDKSTDNFGDYEAWCLLNVLSREADTPDSNYWLNPVSASVKVCIDVHNKKATGVKKLLGVAGPLANFNTSLTMAAIKSTIESKAAVYAIKLASRDTMGIISEFLDKICL